MIEEIRKDNSELIFNVCSGDPVAMDKLRRFDIFDFFRFVENFEIKMKNARR